MRDYMLGGICAVIITGAAVVLADTLDGPVGFVDPAVAGVVKIDQTGCLAVQMRNSSDADRVRGTLVEADANTDGSFTIASASDTSPIGALLEDCSDSDLCWVCVAGRVKVLLKDSTACTRGYWCGTADVAGRADCTTASPPGAVAGHFTEIGHAIEAVTAGSDRLCEIVMHFL